MSVRAASIAAALPIGRTAVVTRHDPSSHGRWIAGLFVAALLFVGPTARGDFHRPAAPDAPLIYGVKGGIHVAVHPAALDGRAAGGPRGLLRVGYEEDGRHYLLNYIAVEPLVGSARGLSELEVGGDGRPGKRFWVGDDLRDGGVGRAGNVSGRVRETAAGRILTFVVHVEPFRNGAQPVVEVSLFEKHPDRLRFRTFSGPGGAAMKQCVLTATMGNQSRCRNLWLRPGAVYAPELYAGYGGDGFVEKEVYALPQLHRTAAGDVVAAVSPDEFEPREVWPLPGGAWRHPGRWMAQFWLKPAGSFDRTLHVRVNGRRTYWGGRHPIPGGIAYENFELREQFSPGRESCFGYTTTSPTSRFGFGYDASPGATPRRRLTAPEEQRIREAEKVRRPLTNGDFRDGLTGWQADGGAASFRTFARGGERALSTFGRKKDADTGRLSQCFQVPEDARELRFFLHGGCDRRRLHVTLWRGPELWRQMTGRQDNTPFEVRWDVRSLRGEIVTLEVVDESTAPWGFLGAHGFVLVKEGER